MIERMAIDHRSTDTHYQTMNTYTLLLRTHEEIEVGIRIEKEFKADKIGWVAPVVDTFIFRTKLSFDEVRDRIILILPAADHGEESAWVLLEISRGDFGGGHSKGDSDRLKSLF
jgi:hypothetical protein